MRDIASPIVMVSKEEFAKKYPSSEYNTENKGHRMRDIAPSTGRSTLDKPRSRREAAKALGIALQVRYRKLLEATGEDETVVATADLAQCMYENVEFVIWALKSQGGMNPPPPEELRRITPLKKQFFEQEPDNVIETEVKGDEVTIYELPCTCPPHDARLIGYKHMTSCPKFVPA